MSKVWFTSDTHFNHYYGEVGTGTGVLRFQAKTRPFASGAEMDAKIIDNINELVGKDDTLYHLGDFCWRNSLVGHYRARINCRKIVLIRGNHEGGRDGLRKHFSAVEDLLEVKVNNQLIVMCHYAMKVWNKSHYGTWHLYGHSHGSLFDDPHSRSIDVGVDCWGLKPISFEQIADVMKTKQWKPIDHHVADHEEQIV
jgi:calcineurin-like phosphoesterase family protein